MTISHLMNCDHSDEGWCLDCVKKLHDKYTLYVEKIDEALESPSKFIGDDPLDTHLRKIRFMRRWITEVSEVANDTFNLDGCCHWETICDSIETQAERLADIEKRWRRHVRDLNNPVAFDKLAEAIQRRSHVEHDE